MTLKLWSKKSLLWKSLNYNILSHKEIKKSHNYKIKGIIMIIRSYKWDSKNYEINDKSMIR